jgi:hypothetical protein
MQLKLLLQVELPYASMNGGIDHCSGINKPDLPRVPSIINKLVSTA